MKFFEESEKILLNVGLGTGQFVQVIGKDVPRLLLRFGISSALALCVSVECLFCIKYFAINLVGSLWAFCLVIIFLSALIIFISLIFKTIRINELFDYLENVVKTSKL